jgi:hypothetical protein
MRTHVLDLSPPRFARLLRELAFGFCKWDATVGGVCRILPETIVLSRAEHESIVRTVESFARLMRRLESRVRTDAALLRAFGVDPALAPLLEAEPDPAAGLAFGRGDFFLTPDGTWVISEFNEDVPGGYPEAVGLTSMLTPSELGGAVEWDLRQSLVRAFDGHERVGLVFATAFSEDLQHCAVLERWLRAAGHHTVLGSPAALTRAWGSTRLSGEAVDALFRFYPGEWMTRLPNLATWRRVLPALPLMNPLGRLITQSKRSFAFMDDGLVSPEERGLAQTFLPHTEALRPAELPRYLAEREALVLKRCFGRMGDAVVLGASCAAGDWEKALAVAARTPEDYAVQQRFRVAPLELADGPMYPTIGAYTVGGRFAGYYSRLASTPLITHEAYHVATVVEAP